MSPEQTTEEEERTDILKKWQFIFGISRFAFSQDLSVVSLFSSFTFLLRRADRIGSRPCTSPRPLNRTQ